MLNVTVTGSTFENVLQLLGLVVVFVLILFATYYCTRLIGKYAYNNKSMSNNIEVIETFSLSQAKYVQIIRVGKNKYVAIAVCKDSVEFLAELSEDELEFAEVKNTQNGNIKFADVLKKIRKK